MARPLPYLVLAPLLAALPMASAQNAAAPAADPPDRKVLLEGVQHVAAPGLPGSLAVYGKDAFPVVLGKDDAARVPVVAAGRVGKGRLVAFGHDGYFGRDALGSADTSRLLRNALTWAAGKANPRVAVLRQPDLLAAWKAAGVDVSDPADRSLAGFDAVVLTHGEIGRVGAPAVRAFLVEGGGVLAASTGWGWMQITGKAIREHPLSAVTAAAGIVWASGTVDRTEPGGFTTAPPYSRFTHGGQSIAALSTRAPLTLDEAIQASASALLAARSAPVDDPQLKSSLAELRRAAGPSSIPTAKAPVGVGTPLARVALTLEVEEASRATGDTLKAHPAAFDFPGTATAGAPLVTRTLSLDLATPGWHSTGLYAAPGQNIAVRFPAGAPPRGLALRIGAHTDENWHHTNWTRVPSISRLFSISGPSLSAGSAFGGLIYVVVPNNAPAAKLQVEIGNAMEAPLFRLGETDLARWRTAIRNYPAPWAELAGKRLIFTVPSSLIRTLEDPDELMTLWDRVVQTQETLVGIQGRARPERIVADRQISAGYMHAGYPIMVPIDGSATLALDVAQLRKEGSWGHFHELGHNLQASEWTFDGTGEVTNNVLAMYVYPQVLGLRFDGGHPAIRDPKTRTERMRKYLDAGARFDQWKRDPFLALTMYIQLVEGFGWDPYRKVFAEYRALPAGDRPRGEEQKRDQWLIRMSRATGKNLGPFFQAWGVPTSEAARSSLRELPTWMPKDFPGA